MKEFLLFSLTYLPYLLQGALVTIEIAAIGVVAGSLIGLLFGLGRVSKVKLFSQISRFYIWVIRGTPLLLQLFMIHFAIPSVIPALTMPPFVSACIALSLNAAAYIAEISRGAIQSIDKGQMEAARSLGLSYGQAMRRVVIPQAFRRMLPPLGNEFIALIKESSLVSTIALYDLLRTGQQIISSTYRYMEIFILVGLIYLLLTTIMTYIVGKVEKKVGAYE
ncbi:amino acid ABC transporter permease [Bacillus salipaludis]|uniref:Amino acid ABC transporter permease n=1 Tax=Bacillus salipaludis TaxID=2547811 RepID=A0A4R5VRI7_9BACI|nr:amino acid ABC transporter permease [Bacillus salipaludis]MDQ6598414.1 amino acid ABC transporter permease [Bacillus salipaludis]TDK61026.1 amino acid ABC transporter permease [Bacillus salipaludis]